MKKHITIISLLIILPIVCVGQDHWSYTWRQFNRHTPALDYVGTLATSSADGSGHSHWSVGCETLDRDFAVFANYKDYLSELGVGYARIQSGWAKTEQKRGKYDYRWLDEIVDGIIEEGVKPWMCLGYGNPLYGAEKGLGSQIFTDKESMEAWKKYVASTVKRYKGRVVAYEIWNEPNLATGVNTPQMYADLMIATAEVIRQTDPQAKILALSLAGTTVARKIGFAKGFFEAVARAGRFDLIDYITYHAYYTNPDEARGLVGMLQDIMKSYAPELKLFQGESGCPSNLEWTHAMKYLEWSEYSQAKWDARRMACDYSMGIPSSIFTIVDLKYPNMQQSFGLLRANLFGEVIYKRPSWHAVQNMAAILTADTCVDETVSAEVETYKSINSVGIKTIDGKKLGVMVYFDGNPPTDSMERELCNLIVHGMSFNDPVYIDVITGKVFQLFKNRGCDLGTSVKFYDFPVWDSPVIVMDKSDVRLVGEALDVKTVGGSYKEYMF